jgi:MoaA/NifB/PqqE/SkfB family radical SAM enzyme
MRDISKLGRIPLPSEIGWIYAKYNWLQPLIRRPFLPKTLVIYVTYRCNARCMMCGIWKHQELSNAAAELSQEELDQILADRLFTDIEDLNINGGEPTLRGDLPDLIRVATGRLSRLQRITMSSNGLLTERLVPQVERIRQICAQENISFSLCISVHGLAEISDQVFGVNGTFDQQGKALAALQEMALGDGLHLSLNCVITEVNLSNLRRLLHWSQERKLPISFALGEVRDRFLNRDMADQVTIAEGREDLVIGFLRELSRNRGLFNPSAFRYHHLANMLQFGQRRTISCHYAMGGVILGPQGDLYYCPHSEAIGNCRNHPAYEIYYDGENLDYRKSALIQDECLHCPPYTFNRLEFEKDFLKYFKFLIIPPGTSSSQVRGTKRGDKEQWLT